MHRFFLPQDYIRIDQVVFPEQVSRQMRNVLRIKPGEHVIVLDNRGSQWEVLVENLSPQKVQGRILKKSVAGGEPYTKLHLYFSLTQREKMEWIFQKCTEVGASAFTPFISSYSIAREKTVDVSRKRRWEKIIQEAAEQTGRGRIPVMMEPTQLHLAVKKVSAGKALNLVAWEGENTTKLKDVLKSQIQNPELEKRINVFIGPEGGFAESEVSLIKKAGIPTFTLGTRLLRMETAAIVSCALILSELEK